MLFKRKTHHDSGRSLRQNLLADIGNAVRQQGGCLRLGAPVTVFVDDLFGEIPITVRYIKEQVPDAKEFEIAESYTTLHLDDNSLKELFNTIKR